MDYKPLKIDLERWYSFSLSEQMGNIGSEFDRYINLQNFDKEYSLHSLYRAIDLLDITRNDPRWRGPRRKEIGRVKELLCDCVLGDNEYNTPVGYIQNYFMDFARFVRSSKT